ncbi:MAG: FAD-dependent oxidoreductase [Anaeromyxobacter sp.]|nr:FAD-dependent oxidoreductase [Anaeromyxobacter sp.]MBL0277095.1 FAD-dependent oxidoreductase [Anaeromyxobacter sp.]
MHAYRYLIVGGGMTGHAAAAAIRELDRSGDLGMIGEEPVPPYARPSLSRSLWAGADRDQVFLPALQGLVHHAGRRAVALDVKARTLTDDLGQQYRYERLLLATGGAPRRLAICGDRVVHLRTIADYDRLRDHGGHGVVVVGGGHVGTEIAAALAGEGRDVTMVFPESGIGARLWPAELSGHVTRTYEEHGVRLLRGHAVVRAEAFGPDRVLVRTNGGAEVLADLVVAGLGIQPQTALAEAAGLAVSDGIEVDEGLRTSAPDVWAAGDVARVWSAALGERVRLEHAENAVAMGHEAGRAMAGEVVAWRQLPSWSAAFFGLGYQAVGKLDARMETVTAWQRPFREGAIYYLERGRVKGVLLWGIEGQVESARELIRRQRPVVAEELARALPG